jgi:transcriptional regulator GlxA family with amidase domain
LWACRGEAQDVLGESAVAQDLPPELGLPRELISMQAFDYYRQLSRVRTYVVTHLGEDLSLKAIARVADLSPKYFSSFFSQRTGINYKKWVTLLRVKQAARMLELNDYSISEVAMLVGFSELRSFERSFKNVMSLTPIEYKRRVRPSWQKM